MLKSNYIGNIESKLKNLSLSNALFVFKAVLNFFRNIAFRVLFRIMYQIIEYISLSKNFKFQNLDYNERTLRVYFSILFQI